MLGAKLFSFLCREGQNKSTVYCTCLSVEAIKAAEAQKRTPTQELSMIYITIDVGLKFAITINKEILAAKVICQS